MVSRRHLPGLRVVLPPASWLRLSDLRQRRSACRVCKGDTPRNLLPPRERRTSPCCRAAAPGAQTPHHPFACFYYESQLARDSSSLQRMATLETERLILRSFREEDVDRMEQLFANSGFMRFSLGIFTERKQTVAFINKVMGWDHAGIPSQFAVVLRGENAIVGYCGFFYHPEHAIE